MFNKTLQLYYGLNLFYIVYLKKDFI